MTDEIDIECGIKGGRVFMRVTDSGGLVSTTTFDPEFARVFGRQLIGQANLISPPDGPEPGPEPEWEGFEPERNYVDPTRKPRRTKGYG